MTFILFAFTFVLAVVHWIIIYKRWRKAEFFFKPAVIVALLATLWLTQPGLPNGLAYFAAALLFSLIGDFLLLFPSFFVFGLVMFLAAHLCYIIGFNIPLPQFDLFSLFLAVSVAVLAGRIYQRLNAGLMQKGLRRLQTPVKFYLVSLSLMFISGFSTLFRVDWSPSAALLAAGGVFLFALSDTLLAWNKFVRPLRTRRIGYMIAYHLAQIAIIAGVLVKL
jgi:uncharacterized membrane protein YhhN